MVRRLPACFADAHEASDHEALFFYVISCAVGVSVLRVGHVDGL